MWNRAKPLLTLAEKIWHGPNGNSSKAFGLAEYETQYERLYGDFAQTVRALIKNEVAGRTDIPSVQWTKARPKDAESLSKKLADRGLSASIAIADEIKDLAGVRLIFYTDSDAEAFVQARVIPSLFDVEWREVKVHHPIAENKQQKYQGIHYIIRLKPDMVTMNPRLWRFSGLRCEIQIQNILMHAWAETSHDILYKSPLADGFGKKERGELDVTLRHVADAYLRRAAYTFQHVQETNASLLKGNDLYQRGIRKTLFEVADNNELSEVLSVLSDHTMQRIDNIEAEYPGILSALLIATERAQTRPRKDTQTSYGVLPGTEYPQILNAALEVMSRVRYLAIAQTLHGYIKLFQIATDNEQRKSVLEELKKLAENNLQVWKQHGPIVQYVVMQELAGLDKSQTELRPVLETIWREQLSTELESVGGGYSQFVITTSPVKPSDAVREIRAAALSDVFSAFDRAPTDEDRYRLSAILSDATRLPNQGYSNELCASILEDADTIIDFFRNRLGSFSLEFRAHLEQQI
ncbi:MAG TPA: RelA/SpoT domain-containing protein, partial [Rhizomicrobium sp.]